jgi:hypothetical protein
MTRVAYELADGGRARQTAQKGVLTRPERPVGSARGKASFWLVLSLVFLTRPLLAASPFEDLLKAPAASVPALATNANALDTNAPMATADSYVADDRYKLRAGDKLSFQILEDRLVDDKDQPKSLLVSDSGEIDVPYIGRVVGTEK